MLPSREFLSYEKTNSGTRSGYHHAIPRNSTLATRYAIWGGVMFVKYTMEYIISDKSDEGQDSLL